MNGITIRVADSFDTPVLLRHRRLMWWDMGQREESALELMTEAATQYFAKTLSEGSYVAFWLLMQRELCSAVEGLSLARGPASLDKVSHDGR